jgi:FkbM family methyltransferase
LKQYLKKIAISTFLILAPHIPSRYLRSFFYNRITYYLLDSRLLPNQLVLRPARHFNVNVLCNPHIYVHQSYYWCGVFYEEEVENYLLREIKPGDTVIDVGMNIGHVAIPAAKLVGVQGRVIAFEPNTDLVKQVETLALEQGFTQLSIKPCGLGLHPGTFPLQIDTQHTGGATFRTLTNNAEFNGAIAAKVEIGDVVLNQEKLPGRVFLKMDVEGYELLALQGLTDTLKIINHAIIEISPEWLKPDELLQLSTLMQAAHFDAYYITNSGKRGASVVIQDLSSQTNILFIKTMKA